MSEPMTAEIAPVATAGLGIKRRKPTRAYFALVAVAGAIGFLLFQGLGNATEYFKTAEEAVKQQNALGSKRFRLEGIVVEGSICAPKDGGVKFLVESNGVQVPVKHDGDPPELFRENIPVVLSGSFNRSIARPNGSPAPVFASDLVMVKHTNDYVQKNSDRVKDYVGKDAAVTAATIPVCASV
jgi:cytochrome c-type biogenesis protein CcmE